MKIELTKQQLSVLTDAVLRHHFAILVGNDPTPAHEIYSAGDPLNDPATYNRVLGEVSAIVQTANFTAKVA